MNTDRCREIIVRTEPPGNYVLYAYEIWFARVQLCRVLVEHNARASAQHMRRASTSPPQSLVDLQDLCRLIGKFWSDHPSTPWFLVGGGGWLIRSILKDGLGSLNAFAWIFWDSGS